VRTDSFLCACLVALIASVHVSLGLACVPGCLVTCAAGQMVKHLLASRPGTARRICSMHACLVLEWWSCLAVDRQPMPIA
jgi:hypothetical protein